MTEAKRKLCGLDVIGDPFLNKDTAFSEAERRELGIEGLVPPEMETLEQQAARSREQLSQIKHDLTKYTFLSNLQDRNRTLFYKLLRDDVAGLMPIVYTPTVGEACLRFGHLYRRPKGLYITDKNRGHIADVLRNWRFPNVRIIVLTDGERILGLGDQGTNGMGIPIGKLALYTACAGVPPAETLPVTLDFGTNNAELLKDPQYLGQRKPRVTGDAYIELVDEFMAAVQEVFPECCVQFEDFAGNNAIAFLERYRDRYCMFNDDIQGTAGVGVAGIFGAMRVTGESISDQTVLFGGAGAAAAGIADLLVDAMVEQGSTKEAAQSRIWMFDSKGLITTGRGPVRKAFQAPYAHDAKAATTFADAVRVVRPTAIIGVSTIAKLFDRDVIEEMSRINERPVIFPYSNPTSRAECTAEEAVQWSDGRAIFASGSPFFPVEYKGRTYIPGQGNNVYIFPALGLAVYATRASRVTDEMFLCAAQAVSDQVTEDELASGLIYPPMSKIFETSVCTAVRIAELIYECGLADMPKPPDVEAYVRSLVFEPVYRSLL